MSPSIKRNALVLLLIAASLPRNLPAQQWVTDDTGVTEPQSCQLEVWAGERSNWIVPACNVGRQVEVSAGVGWARNRPDVERQLEYAVQGKIALRPVASGQLGLAIAAGTGLSRERRFGSAYVYVPVGRSFADDRLVLHGNLGWRYNHADGSQILTYGGRGDLLVSARASLITELFGANGDGLPPEFQTGTRVTLWRARLQADLTYGRAVQHRASYAGAGWTLGLAWTPRPLRRPLLHGARRDALATTTSR